MRLYTAVVVISSCTEPSQLLCRVCGVNTADCCLLSLATDPLYCAGNWVTDSTLSLSLTNLNFIGMLDQLRIILTMRIESFRNDFKTFTYLKTNL